MDGTLADLSSAYAEVEERLFGAAVLLASTMGIAKHMVPTQSPARSVPTRTMEFDACFDDLPKIDWEKVGDRAGAFILRNMPELMREQLPRIMAAPNKNRITKR